MPDSVRPCRNYVELHIILLYFPAFCDTILILINFTAENSRWNINIFAKVFPAKSPQIHPTISEFADWEYVDTIVPPLPTAKVALSDGTQYGGSDLDATVIKLIRNYDGQRIVLRDKELEPSEGAGIYGSGLYLKYLDATVTFSMPVVSGVEVLVETWDHSSNYTLTLEAIDGGITFEVPDYPAHYTITASFQGNNGVYETTFTFNVGDADSI